MKNKISATIIIFYVLSINYLFLNRFPPNPIFLTHNNTKIVHDGCFLEITEKDNFILYDWPTVSPLSTGDFTIETKYRTSKQEGVQDDVAIFSNERDSREGAKYGRFFSILLLTSGKIGVRFQGYEPKNRTFIKGKIESNYRIDNGEWHHILVTRNASIISLYVDGLFNAFSRIKPNIDLDGQEQKIVIGGGNDRNFRHCQIDELRVWKMQRYPSQDGNSLLDIHNLIADFKFDNDTDGIVLKDCSSLQGDAIRVGKVLQTSAAFVGNADQHKTRCLHNPNVMSNQNKTLILTYLGFDCSGYAELSNKPTLQKGSLNQVEAYLGSLWLDARRLNISLSFISDCVPLHIQDMYTTSNINFIDIKDTKWKSPDVCLGTIPAFVKRFLLYDYLLQNNFFDAYSYIVTIDLRDSRILKTPIWSKDRDLWLQSIRKRAHYVCGGFQAGKFGSMKHLMSAMAEEIVRKNCTGNDQNILNTLYHSKRLGTNRDRVELDGNMINSQHTRRHDGGTFFLHGDWWMSMEKRNDDWAKKAYPYGIPYNNR